jgi:glycosyltransferase involved in cell wall biosynthesis
LGLSNVRFLGHVAHENLPAIYDQCDIFVNASLVDNFPGALLEASASGLVVISTKAGGIPFLYEHNNTALLVELGDASALALAVETVLRDVRVATRLTSAGESLVRMFQWTVVREVLLNVYELSPDRSDHRRGHCLKS